MMNESKAFYSRIYVAPSHVERRIIEGGEVIFIFPLEGGLEGGGLMEETLTMWNCRYCNKH